MIKKSEAVEIAHAIAELIKTRDLLDNLSQGGEALVPIEPCNISMLRDGVAHRATIPPHVLRYIIDSNMLLEACRVLEDTHRVILESYGIEVEDI